MWKINYFILLCVLSACSLKSTDTKNTALYLPVDTLKSLAMLPSMNISMLEKQMLEKGLVDIKNINEDIIVDIKYAQKDNFLGIDVYGEFNKCYLQEETAEKLNQAQIYLSELHPEYILIVFDCARPRSAQQLMWDSIKCPPQDKPKYLCNPIKGSIHNYGCAVDVSIVDDKGNLLDMGCAFDYFGSLAYPIMEQQHLLNGDLSQEQYDNRQLLRSIMYKAGFFNIQTEWWHFNAYNRAYATEHFPIIE